MKRIYSILLALCVSSMLFAQLSIWNGSSDIWTKGAGTEASPYLIESAEQLAFISDMVNGGVTTYENTYFKLMTNIDLNNLTWVPIGSSEKRAFKGNIDGNNKTIMNNPIALFGYISHSSINRLKVIDVNGMVAKKSHRSTIKNCRYVGKRVMISQAESSTIRNTHSHVNINNRDIKRSAGLVDSTYFCLIEDCSVTGCITSELKNLSIERTVGYEDEKPILNLTDHVSTAGLVALSFKTTYIRCSSACNCTTILEKDYYAGGACYDNYCSGLVGISCGDTISYCSSTKYAKPTILDYYYNTYYSRYYSHILNVNTGIVGVNSYFFEDIKQSWNSKISNTYTINDSIYIKTIQDVLYYSYQKKYMANDYFPSLRPIVINSYSSTDKTEASMKSASFPIILNTDSTVFIQDKFGVNDGYPIYKEQVYAITNPATDIQLTSANLNASYYALNADSIGFEYKESADKTHWYKRVSIDTLSSDYSYKLENLATGTEYTYRFWVAQNGVFYFGEALTFTTQECSTNTYPEAATICNGEEYEFANKILTKSGVYYDTLKAVNGCDSIIELTLTVSPINEIQKYDTIDAGESYDFFGNILTETGTYKHYVPAGAYCNLVIMNLYVKQPSVVVSVQSSNPSLGTVIGGGTYEKYTPVTLTAIPNQGCRFVKWTDGNTDNPRVIIPESDCTYIAEFEEVNYTLTLAANDVAMGNVFGAGTYKYGTEVAINAIPNTGYQFTQWSDNDTNASRTITIASDLSLTAYFQPIKYTIIATANDETLGTVYGSGEYAYNTSVSLMAVPQNGCEFITWSNGVNSNPYTFVAVDNVTLQAIFRATSTGMEDVDVDANTPTQKILRDGQLLIIRDGKTYNVMGQEL